MRLLATLAALAERFLRLVGRFLWLLFGRDDPAGDIDREAAAVRAQAAAIDAEDDAPRDRRPDPVAVARRYLAGRDAPISRLPPRARAWLAVAGATGVDVSRASNDDLRAWLIGADDHPAVPREAVWQVMRGDPGRAASAAPVEVEEVDEALAFAP